MTQNKTYSGNYYHEVRKHRPEYKQYQNEYNKREDVKARKLESQRRIVKKNRELLSNHVCLFCGCDENIVYHHADSNKKELSIGAMLHMSTKTLLKELDKCWSLCSSCHIKLHQRLVDPLPECYDSILKRDNDQQR